MFVIMDQHGNLADFTGNQIGISVSRASVCLTNVTTDNVEELGRYCSYERAYEIVNEMFEAMESGKTVYRMPKK